MKPNSAGYELDWEDYVCRDNSTEIILPEGDYPFNVVDYEKSYHNGSIKIPPCPKVIVDCEFDGGKYGTVNIKSYFFLYSTMEWKICQFYRSIGKKKWGERIKMDWNSIIGSRGIAHVNIESWKDDSGKIHTNNKISEFLDPANFSSLTPLESEDTSDIIPF